MKISNKIIPYIVAFVVFTLASIIYFHPVLKGQKLNQSDITQFRGMVKEINDYRADKKTEPYWTGASFSGMPAYQISTYYPNDFVRLLDRTLRFLPRPADYTFLYFLSFFVLMMALKVNWRLAILGSLAFGFSTYLIIIFGAGHNAKAHAIAYMPLVLAGVLWVFQKRYILGFLVTGVAMALEIYTNHPQMTYYLGFCLLILGIVELINAIKEKVVPTFIKQSIIIIAAVLLGIGANSPRLMAMKEYADHSTRGKSELTINPDGSIQRASDRINYSLEVNGISLNDIQNFNQFVDFSTKGIYTYDENQEFTILYSGPIPEANVTTPAQSGVEATAKTKSDVDEVIVLSGGKDSQGLVVGDQRDYMILPISGERGAKVTLQDDGKYLIQPIKGMGGIDENGRLDYSFHSNTETFNRKELDFTIAYRIFHAEADTLANSRAMGEKEYNHLQNLEVRLCSDKIKGGCFDIEQAAQIGANIAVSLGASIQVKNGTYVPSDNFEKGYFTEAAKTNRGYVMPAKIFEALSDGDGYYSTETQKALAKDVEEKCFGLEDVTFNEVANCGYNATINFGGKN